MEEVSLEYGRAYLHDRVKELRNQEPNGDPFVFLGIAAIASTLLSLRFMPLPGSLNLAIQAARSMMSNFSLGFQTIELSHDVEKHMTKRNLGEGKGTRTVIAAKPCLDELDQAIDDLFNSTNELDKAKILVGLNMYKFVGLRD